MKYILSILLLLSFNLNAQQSLTKINGWNAYVHLPDEYASQSTKKYPAIVFFPGLGEVGTVASKVIANGPGAYIAQGWNGNVVNGTDTTKFIVISLQPPATYPVELAMNNALIEIEKQYRVRELHGTGLSHGGLCAMRLVTKEPFTNRFKTIVSVEGMRADDNKPWPQVFESFAKSGGKMLNFEQAQDQRGGDQVVATMNKVAPGSATYLITNFSNGGHCCWNEFYGGSNAPGKFIVDGKSQTLYEWIASTVPPTNTRIVPPVVVVPPVSVPPTVYITDRCINYDKAGNIICETILYSDNTYIRKLK